MALKPHSISRDVYTPKQSGSRITPTWSSWCWTAGGPTSPCNTTASAWFFMYLQGNFITFCSFLFKSWMIENWRNMPWCHGPVCWKSRRTLPLFFGSLGKMQDVLSPAPHSCENIDLDLKEGLPGRLTGTESFRWTFEKHMKSRVVAGNTSVTEILVWRGQTWTKTETRFSECMTKLDNQNWLRRHFSKILGSENAAQFVFQEDSEEGMESTKRDWGLLQYFGRVSVEYSTMSWFADWVIPWVMGVCTPSLPWPHGIY